MVWPLEFFRSKPRNASTARPSEPRIVPVTTRAASAGVASVSRPAVTARVARTANKRRMRECIDTWTRTIEGPSGSSARERREDVHERVRPYADAPVIAAAHRVAVHDERAAGQHSREPLAVGGPGRLERLGQPRGVQRLLGDAG